MRATFSSPREPRMPSEQRTRGGGLLRTTTIPSPTRGRIELSAGPVSAIFYVWVGGFWIWLLIDVLADQYPALFAALVH